MAYFKNFPTVKYCFATESKTDTAEFQNITAYSRLLLDSLDDDSLYTFYDIEDGARSDIVSYNLYNTTDYYWTFYLVNEHIRKQGWPLSYDELNRKIVEDLPGEVLVFMPQDEVDKGDNTNFLQHAMIEQFMVGDRIFGQISGAKGTVYARNVNLGQMFVRLDEGSPGFLRNESVVDKQVGQPNSTLICRIVHSPADLAVHHFEDGDGDHIDVDYALDFRGRGSELDPDVTAGLPITAGPGPDGNYIGGVVGDIVTPDPYASTSSYKAITFREYYEDVNDNLSRIKIIRPSAITNIARLFHTSIGET